MRIVVALVVGLHRVLAQVGEDLIVVVQNPAATADSDERRPTVQMAVLDDGVFALAHEFRDLGVRK